MNKLKSDRLHSHLFFDNWLVKFETSSQYYGVHQVGSNRK